MRIPNLSDAPAREVMPGFHGRFVHSERMTLAYWEIDAGAVLQRHAHPHEQVAHVLEGTFEMTVGGVTHRLEVGDVAVVPPDAPHSGSALTRCRIVDVFCPVREDYR
jgi:quercetin dioxygenase-like cupin family protein